MKRRMRSGRRVGEVEKLCFFILFGNTTKQSAFPFCAITPSAKRHVAIPPRPVQKPIMFAVTQRAVSVAPLCRTSAAPKRRASFVVRAGEVESSGSSYYTVVKGVKLDRKVVDDCVAFEKNDGSIDLQEAERIFADIVDGPVKGGRWLQRNGNHGHERGAGHRAVRVRQLQVGARREGLVLQGAHF